MGASGSAQVERASTSSRGCPAAAAAAALSDTTRPLIARRKEANQGCYVADSKRAGTIGLRLETSGPPQEAA